MKFFTLILAVIVLSMSGIPCMDGAFAAKGKDSFSIGPSKGHRTDHNTADACSPFCTCSCCAAVTIFHSTILLGHTTYAAAKFYESYLPSNIMAISLPVWQPPQLS